MKKKFHLEYFFSSIFIPKYATLCTSVLSLISQIVTHFWTSYKPMEWCILGDMRGYLLDVFYFRYRILNEY